MSDYLDGPNGSHLVDTYIDCYRSDPSIEAVEAAATLAATIDHWLCGPYDDGDESQEYLLTHAVERAARFIAEQPCRCIEDLCARCMAIGCGYGEHRTPACAQSLAAASSAVIARNSALSDLKGWIESRWPDATEGDPVLRILAEINRRLPR